MNKNGEQTLDYISSCILAIQSDAQLSACFINVLKMGSNSQQIRVHRLLEETQKLNAPKEVTQFIRMLSDNQLASKVLSILEESP
jgi:hypothetical protein